MGAKVIIFAATVLLSQIHFGQSVRRTFGSSVAMVGDGFGSYGVINQGNGVKVINDNGEVKVIKGGPGKVVVIGDDDEVRVVDTKTGNPGNAKGKNVVYFGDGGGSVVMVGDNGGSVGMVGGSGGGVSTIGFNSFGNGKNFNSVGVVNGGSFVGTGGAVSAGGVSVGTPGFVRSHRVAGSPFGAGAFAGAGAGAGAVNDANNLLNFVTSATGMGMPFWPL